MVIEFTDLETNGLSHEADTVWCIGVSSLEQEDADVYGPDEIEAAIERLEKADMVVAHNGIMFDFPVMGKLYKAKFKKKFDTLVTARLMYPDRLSSPVGGNSLGEWGDFLGMPKGEHTDWTQYTEEMGIYCGGDTLICKEIYLYQQRRWKLWKEAIRLEHEVAEIISRQHWNGVTIDVQAATNLYELANNARVPLLQKLQESFPPIIETMKKPAYYYVEGFKDRFATKGQARQVFKKNEILDGPLRTKEHPFNPRSGDQIVEAWKVKYGKWPSKAKTKKGGISTDGDVMERLADKYEEARWIVDWRMCQQRAELAQSWISCISPVTGRLHHSVNTNGAVTGRMTHSDPNVNSPKIRKGKNKEILYGFDGDFGFECRSCFCPRPGWWQVGTDASGLELRMLAHYMAQFDDGEYVNVLLNGDIHEFNRVSAGLDSRDDAKTFIYAFLYGAGDAKIGKIIHGGDREGADLKAKFLRSLPALARVKEWVRTCTTVGYVIGLDGRQVPLRSEHAALNTVLQGGGALVMKKALTIRYAEINKRLQYGTQWADILNVHDEFQSEAEKKQYAEFIGKTSVKAITAAGEYFELRCPLTGEYAVGKSWAECH